MKELFDTEARAHARENYPFPHNTDNGERVYACGILPDVSADEMNRAMLRMYNRWREVYLTTEGCNEGELRVSGGKSYEMGTCSEGTGYGMLLSVYMANADNNAHEDFDAIYRFAKNHLIPECGLMKWVVDRHCKDLSEWSAPDGDLDIAFALLMAHKQWGSGGEINYLAEGKAYVQRILDHAVNRPQYTIARAQLTSNDPNVKLNNTMTSYQMPGTARLFSKVTENDEWAKVVDAIYAMFDYFSRLNASGLPPFLVMIDTYGPVADRPYDYGYDPCRVPWRVVMDYLWYGADNNSLAHDYPTQLAAWFSGYMESIGWDFDRVSCKFELDGTPAKNSWPSPRNIVGMLAPAAMADEANRELLNKAYAYLSRLDMTHDGDAFGDYYQDTLAVLGMLTITGNMPNFFEIAPHPENKLPEIEVRDTKAPTKPENFRVIGVEKISDTEYKASFAWEASESDGGRVLYSIYKDEYLYYAPLKPGTDEAPCEVRFLDPNKVYEFRITAQDDAGNRSESDIVLVSTAESE